MRAVSVALMFTLSLVSYPSLSVEQEHSAALRRTGVPWPYRNMDHQMAHSTAPVAVHTAPYPVGTATVRSPRTSVLLTRLTQEDLSSPYRFYLQQVMGPDPQV